MIVDSSEADTANPDQKQELKQLLQLNNTALEKRIGVTLSNIVVTSKKAKQKKQPPSSKQVTEEELKRKKERSFRIANAYIQDAIQGYDHKHKVDTVSLVLVKIMRNFFFRAAITLLTALLFALALAEKPSVFSLPLGVTQGIELFILIVFIIREILILATSKRKAFFKRQIFSLIIIAVCMLMMIDIIVYVSLLGNSIRVTRVLRFLFAIRQSQSLQLTFRHIVNVFLRVWVVIVMIMAFVLFFTMLGRLIFMNVPNNTFYATFLESFLSLFTCLTTANFPDVMLPAYRQSRWFSIFYIIFLILGIYVILSVTLAMVYAVYREGAKNEVIRSYMKQRAALMAAFKALDYEKLGFVSFSQWEKLFKIIRPLAQKGEDRFLFSLLDVDKNDKLEMGDFLQLCDFLILHLKKKKGPNNSTFMKVMKKLQQPMVARLRKLMKKTGYRMVSIFLTIFSILMVIYYIVLEVMDIPIWVTVIYHIVDCLLILAFVGEIILKLLAFGLLTYFKNLWRSFDFLLVAMMILTKIVVECILQLTLPKTAVFIRVIQFLQIFRSFRLFTTINRLKLLAESFVEIVILLFYFFIILVVHFYTFSMLGMEIFGNKVLPTIPGMKGTDYDNAGYYDIAQFDDVISALVTLFHLTIVNNWHVTAKGHMKAIGDASLIYFIIFYFLTVTITVNLLVAFVVEAFMFKIEENRQESKQESTLEEQQLQTLETEDQQKLEGEHKPLTKEDEFEISRSVISTNISTLNNQVFQASKEADNTKVEELYKEDEGQENS